MHLKIIDSHIHVGLRRFCLSREIRIPYEMCNTYENTIALMDQHDVAQAVIPRYRNQGIASAMLRHYRKHFPLSMAKTNANNQAIIRLLKKNGYMAQNPAAPEIVNWVRDECAGDGLL